MTPDHIQNNIAYLTGKAHRALREAVSAELRSCGVELAPAHLPMMGCLALSFPEAIVQREFLDRLDMDRHRVSRLVKEMVEMGVVEVQVNPENKRENLVALTEKGRGHFEFIEACASRVFERAAQGSTAEEVQITKKTLINIITNLSDNEH
ncbi:MAG: hypothetical protein RL754_411 [Bacteroidota bacterium]|jgi:DNA-binding MarR family transcriptional regulator